MNIDFRPMLLGKDLRSVARANEVVQLVQSQQTFDELFVLLLHHERLLVMRAADAVEKITLKYPQFLLPHKKQLLQLLKGALDKELKWHISILIARIPMDEAELEDVWTDLSYWALNPNESKIVRVNALQGLFELSQSAPMRKQSFLKVLKQLQHVSIPSLQARIRKLSKLI